MIHLHFFWVRKPKPYTGSWFPQLHGKCTIAAINSRSSANPSHFWKLIKKEEGNYRTNRDFVTYTIQLCADSYKTPPVPSSSIALNFYELIYLLRCFDSGNLEIKTEQKRNKKMFIVYGFMNCLWMIIGGVYHTPSTKNE